MVFNRCCQLASPSSPFPNCQRQLDSAHAPHASRALAIAHTRSRSSFAHSRAHAPMHWHTRSHMSQVSTDSSWVVRPPWSRAHAQRHRGHARGTTLAPRTRPPARAQHSRTAHLACAQHARDALHYSHNAQLAPQRNSSQRFKRVRATCTMGHTRATHYRAARHGSPCATPTPRTTRARSFSLRTHQGRSSPLPAHPLNECSAPRARATPLCDSCTHRARARDRRAHRFWIALVLTRTPRRARSTLPALAHTARNGTRARRAPARPRLR